MAVKADASTDISWIIIMTFWFWIPNLLVMYYLIRSLWRGLKKSSKWSPSVRVRKPVSVVRQLSSPTRVWLFGSLMQFLAFYQVMWHAMLFVSFGLLVFFELALCFRADGTIEWSWLQVFLPLFALDSCLIVWTVVGFITRSQLERRTMQVSAVRFACAAKSVAPTYFFSSF